METWAGIESWGPPGVHEYTEKGRVHKDRKGMVQKAGGLPGQVGVRKERPEGFRMGYKIKAEKASLGVAIWSSPVTFRRECGLQIAMS